MATETVKPVNLDYNDLVQEKDLSPLIEEAFGPDGLGILTVSNIPQLKQLRDQLLPLAHKFATLPEDVKQRYEHRESNFSLGWSHGKERFNGKLDVAKGSFYANPQYDEPTRDMDLIKQFPFYCHPNIWPEEHVPELSHAFKQLGQLIVQVGLLIAKQCDSYVYKLWGNAYEPKDKLYQTISNSKTTKGRLLYYFPIPSEHVSEHNDDDDDDQCAADNWCGWHLDHDSLTGLTSAMFLDSVSGEPVTMTDPKAGLFIRNRKNQVIKATWSPDQLAFQIGESAQIHSGGKLVATPHCVRGTVQPHVARATLAVFMQPQWDVPMTTPRGVALEEAKIDILEEGMDFNAFTQKRE
jgi:isopenicillin N synthase-like dioxygenase